MWTPLDIILLPLINRFLSVNYIAELMLIQTPIFESSVKTLNKSIRGRLSRLNKHQLITTFKGPLIQCTAGEFRPPIGSYHPRIPVPSCGCWPFGQASALDDAASARTMAI